MNPEVAALMAQLHERVATKRAAGLYAVDDIQQPLATEREPFLAEQLAAVAGLAEISPNLHSIGSTRRGIGGIVGKAKATLVRATSQPLIEMGDQSTAFNAVLISYISQLAQEVAELREEVARLSADRGPEDTRRA